MFLSIFFIIRVFYVTLSYLVVFSKILGRKKNFLVLSVCCFLHCLLRFGFFREGVSESGEFYGGPSMDSRLLNSFRLAFSYLHRYQCVHYVSGRTDNVPLMYLYVIRGGLKDDCT